MHSQTSKILLAAGIATLASQAIAADAVDQYQPAPIANEISASPYAIYLKGFTGITFGGGAQTDGLIGGTPQSVDTEQDVGFTIGGAVGVEINSLRFGSLTPRAELEFSYNESNVDEIFFSGNGPALEANIAGDISTFNGFVNTYLDLDTGTKLTPYAGVGIGFGHVDFDFAYGPNPAAPVVVTESDTGFAAQAIVGASYALTEKFALDFDARYQRTFDVASPRVNGAGAVTGIVEGDVDNFAITTGIRMKF